MAMVDGSFLLGLLGRSLMRRTLVLVLLLVLSASAAVAQNKTPKRLDIYVIDVEGGNAVLFVAPSGESMLVDTGNGGDGAVRDAGRIMAAVKDAGVKQIDHLIITHYHNDHIGGLSELANHISIKEFIDHGANSQPGPNIDPVLQRYSELYGQAKHRVNIHMIEAAYQAGVQRYFFASSACAYNVLLQQDPNARALK